MLNSLAGVLAAFHIQVARPTITPNELIIWNVGQGQWVTVVKDNRCFHFDMGGEKFDLSQVEKVCGARTNFAFFSHWDQDHLSFVRKASGRLANFCVAALPNGPAPSSKKQNLFKDVGECSFPENSRIEEIYTLGETERATSNDYSRVFEYDQWLIAQGDSPLKQEKIWAHRIHSQDEVRVLILGHHGSRTSTSEDLLRSLPGLKVAISSARISRYGHPHAEVLRRLRKFGVACLRTEFWGNIHVSRP